jgi:hypothetical protein
MQRAREPNPCNTKTSRFHELDHPSLMQKKVQDGAGMAQTTSFVEGALIQELKVLGISGSHQDIYTTNVAFSNPLSSPLSASTAKNHALISLFARSTCVYQLAFQSG